MESSASLLEDSRLLFDSFVTADRKTGSFFFFLFHLLGGSNQAPRPEIASLLWYQVKRRRWRNGQASIGSIEAREIAHQHGRCATSRTANMAFNVQPNRRICQFVDIYVHQSRFISGAVATSQWPVRGTYLNYVLFLFFFLKGIFGALPSHC